MDLDVAMTPHRVGNRAFAWEVPDTWQQGRGAFGGLIAGALIGAGEAVLADPARPLRALTLEIMAPAVVGASTIEVTPLRAGSSVTVMAAAMRQAGEVVAHGVLTFGRDRDDAQWQALTPPPLPPFADVAVGVVGPPGAPVFTQHVEFRPLTGVPFDGGPPNPEVLGWVRFRAPGAARGAGYIAACCDSFWPAALIGLPAPRPMATLTFTLLIVGDLRDVPLDAPLAYRARSLAAGSGYVPEVRELWTADGRLIAVNPQTFALSR
jgi:acyl-CoA thioesterase